MQVEESHYTC